MGKWTCSECGISRAEAARERWWLGLRRLDGAAKTCSQECGRERERRMLRENYGAGSSYLYPMPDDWHCSECGCTVEQAHERRVARGLAPLTSRHQTCSPECSRKLRVTPEREALRAARKVLRAERARRRDRMRRKAENGGASPIYSLAVNVRRLRSARGMTQEVLARRADVTRSYVAMVEAARIKGPRPVTLDRLAKVLGTAAAKLLAKPPPRT